MLSKKNVFVEKSEREYSGAFKKHYVVWWKGERKEDVFGEHGPVKKKIFFLTSQSFCWLCKLHSGIYIIYLSY